MRSAIAPKIGDKVLILYPAYVAGRVGKVCAKEVLSGDYPSERWLIQVNSEDIVVSLNSKEFEVVNDDFEIS
ncbi:hypothetical protein SD80_023890 [Scytonema tolypothrichoides VB-61278]|nr:hypothetical protein SD80_023890 [Scytonema tolypothrichoides VB-61278]